MAWLPSTWDNDLEEAALRDCPDQLSRRISGEDLELETIAAAILARGRRGITRHSELRDYLSESQLALRLSREVYPSQGFPEQSLYIGLYRRAFNPQSRGRHSSNSSPNLDDDGHHDQ